MKAKIQISTPLTAIALALLLAGCGSGGDKNQSQPLPLNNNASGTGQNTGSNASGGQTTSPSTGSNTVVNASPIISVGDDLQVNAGDMVVLTVTITDDDTSSQVLWQQDSGTQVALSSSSSPTVSFVAPALDHNEQLIFTVSVNDGTNPAVLDSVTVDVIANTVTQPEPQPEPVPEIVPDNSQSWLINDTGKRSSYILENNSGLGVEVNVQSVREQSINGKSFTVVQSYGVPDYQVTATAELINQLNSRPKASSDFNGGSTSAKVGETIEFGQDIGFKSNISCDTNAGYGYWPPGPECPTSSPREGFIPNNPQASDQDCDNGLGVVGYMVNGSSIFNWSDGQSYGNGVWYNLAPIAEGYDVDICGGHAARGEYHHHFYSSCLAEMVGDSGNDHSPLYGYAADGYPVYGPWHDNGVLAHSAWITRDYSATSTTGCSDGKRSCVLNDAYDISKGTKSAASQGPGFTDTVLSLSRNSFVAFNGYFFEDYYWDQNLTALGGKHLDQFNGHSDQERGYHYHLTLTMNNGKLSPAFPYTIGPRFAGKLQDNAITSCSAGSALPPPGGRR